MFMFGGNLSTKGVHESLSSFQLFQLYFDALFSSFPNWEHPFTHFDDESSSLLNQNKQTRFTLLSQIIAIGAKIKSS